MKLSCILLAVVASIGAANAETYVQKTFVKGLIGDQVPSISITSSNFDFGNVFVGSSSNLIVTARNPSTSDTLLGLKAILGSPLFNITSNTCGSDAAPVNLGPGQSCSLTVSFHPLAEGSASGAISLFAPNSANGAISRLLEGVGVAVPTENIIDTSLDSLQFTSVQGDTVFQSVYFKNTGGAASTNTFVTLTPDSGSEDVFSLTSNTCGSFESTVSLSSNQTCSADVLLSSLHVGTYSGSISITSGDNGATSIVKPITATVNPAVAYLMADMQSLSFGAVPSGEFTSRTITITNQGGFVPASGLQVAIPFADGLTTVSNSCGTQGSPVSLAPNASCQLTLQYGGSVPNGLAGKVLSFTSSSVESPLTVPLSGTAAGFDTFITYSASNLMSIPISRAQAGSGILTVNQTVLGRTEGTSGNATIYVVNSGTIGPINSGFWIIGDTDQFQVTSISLANTQDNTTIPCSSTITRTSISPCQTGSIENGDSPSNMTMLKIVTKYTPTSEASDWLDYHAISLVPYSENGTTVFDDVAAEIYSYARTLRLMNWSSAYNSLTNLTASDTAFGSKTVGSATTKTVYLRAWDFSNGLNSASFTLSGDTSQFRIVSVKKSYSGSSSVANYTDCGVTISSTSVSECFTSDRKVGDTSANKPHMHIVVEYRPTSAGSHSLTITPTSSLGTMSGTTNVFEVLNRAPIPSITYTGTAN